MGKRSGLIKSLNSIYDVRLIIIMIIGRIFCLWQSFLVTTRCIQQCNKHRYLQIMAISMSITWIHLLKFQIGLMWFILVDFVLLCKCLDQALGIIQVLRI